MARSRHIYVVMGAVKVPIAAFTVKHELVAWIKRKEHAPDSPLRFMHVFRLDDGGYPGHVTELGIDDLLASDG